MPNDFRPNQTNFTSGELSPAAYGRVDIVRYTNGAKLLQNFVIQPQGGVMRRSGTRFVAEVKNSAKKVRLIPFEFSSLQAYILEFGDQYIRFYRNEGRIESPPGTAYEISTPYTEAQLPDIKFTQSADVLYIAHPLHAPRKLSRTGHTSWTLSTLSPEDGPYLDRNKDLAHTLTASALTGSITLTSSKSYFTSSMVGAKFRIEESVAAKNNSWKANTAYTAGDRVQSNGQVYQATTTATSGTREPIHDVGNETDGGVSWDYLHSGFGVVTITGYTNATTVTATVNLRLPNSATGGTLRWREGAWSDYRGWPSVVTFHQERLTFANTSYQPQTLWMSASANYEGFAPTAQDDEVYDDTAITYTLASNKVNNVVWLESGVTLQVGTIGAEWQVRPASTSQPLSPTNIEVSCQTEYGSRGAVRTQRVGSSTLYVQRSGKKLREFIYDYQVDSFRSNDLSLIAEHMLREGGYVTDAAFQLEPLSIWWGVRNDGQLIGMTYLKDQEVIGWHRHILGGTNSAVERIACIPSPDISANQLWMVVKRTINGGTKRYIEFMEGFFYPENEQDKDEMFFVDSGLTYDGTPVTSVTGLSHLEGQTVSVCADGAVRPNAVVASGGITLDTAASVIHVGLPFVSKLTTLPTEGGGEAGSSQGKTERKHSAAIRLWNSLGLEWGVGDDVTFSLNFREPEHAMDKSPPLFSGFKALATLAPYAVGQTLTFLQQQPYPLTILSYHPEGRVYG